MENENVYTPENQLNNEQNFPMRWHNFLIYFSLWAGAILNLFSAFSYFTGMIYGEDVTKVYLVFPKLKGIDRFMGVAILALAVLMIVTRFALAGYKRNGPRLLIICYVFNATCMLLYCVFASMITPLIGFGDLLSEMSPSIAGGIAMLIINGVYYKKRTELFVN